ncbi:hypothetical protein PM082_017409 [Marasmius tenuissimus]|nr:hypothetical protein PM082_017409 [Marasmius tenuissimus]
MANRIAKLTDNRTIDALSEHRKGKDNQPFDFVNPRSNIRRTLNETTSDRGTTPGTETKKMKIKPIRPDKYNGEVSARKFLRFVKAVRRYMIDGNVPIERQVDIMTNDLEGIAYNFVERLCGNEPENWTLNDVFIELYNHIFPLNYQSEQCKKLKNHTQNGRRVRTYFASFEELCDTIGNIDDDSKVATLWDGFDPIIQKGLYNRELHPERSSWNDVVITAETVELVEGITTGNNAGNKHQGHNGNKKKFRKEERTSSFSVTVQEGSSKPKNSTSEKKPFSKKDNNKKGKGQTLSAEKKKQYRAEGRCFGCGELGHLVRDCPPNTTVKGDKGSKNPPGLTSHNLEFELPGMNDMWEDEEDMIATLTLNSMAPVRLDWFTDVEQTLFEEDFFSTLDEYQLNEEDGDESDDEGSVNCPDSEDDETPYLPPLESVPETQFEDDDSDDEMPPLQDVSDTESEMDPEEGISEHGQEFDDEPMSGIMETGHASSCAITIQPSCPTTDDSDIPMLDLDIEMDSEVEKRDLCPEFPCHHVDKILRVWDSGDLIVDYQDRWSVKCGLRSRTGGFRWTDSAAWYDRHRMQGHWDIVEKVRNTDWEVDLFTMPPKLTKSQSR